MLMKSGNFLLKNFKCIGSIPLGPQALYFGSNLMTVLTSSHFSGLNAAPDDFDGGFTIAVAGFG